MYTFQAQVAFGPATVTDLEIRSFGRRTDLIQEQFLVNGLLRVRVPTDHFLWSRRVNDEVVLTRRGRDFIETPETWAEEVPIPNCAVVVLESPHRCEYAVVGGQFSPVGPLRNVQSRNRFLAHIQPLLAARGLLQNCGGVILCNPVPYQASMDRLMEPDTPLQDAIRNAVWKALFNAGFCTDFVRRLTLYNPAVIINACTYDLRPLVGNVLAHHYRELDPVPRVFTCSHHPSAWTRMPALVEM